MLSVSHNDAGVLPRIADAIALAGPGATIVVQPGVYREHLQLTGDVSLVAEDGRGTVTIEAPDGVAVFSSGGTVRLKGFYLAGASDQYPAVQVGSGTLQLAECEVHADGIVAVHATGGRLDMHDCVVVNPAGAGLLFEQAATGSVTGSVIRDIDGPGIVIAAGADPEVRGCTVTEIRGPGILSTRDGRGRVLECEITAVDGPAVAVEEGGSVQLLGTVIRDTPGTGIVVTGGRPTVETCELRGIGGHGVVLAGQANPVLRRCELVAIDGHGILMLDTAAGLIDDCTIEDTGSAALAVTGSAAPTVQGGRFAGGDEVVVLLDGGVTGRFIGARVEGGRARVAAGDRWGNARRRGYTFVVVVMACWCPAAGSRYLIRHRRGVVGGVAAESAAEVPSTPGCARSRPWRALRGRVAGRADAPPGGR
jgi:hypothetical protein